MRLRWFFLIVAMALVAAACAQADDPQADSTADDSADASSEPESGLTATPGTENNENGENSENGENGEPRASSDRIVILDNGQIATVLPDGADRVDLTTPDGHVNFVPTWSPDATRIAWTRVDTTAGTAEIATSRFDGSSPFNAAVDSPPFYFYWDPGSRNLAYLSPTVGGIDLGVIDVTDEGDPRRIDRGQPYYFSWSSDGDEMLVHASALRLDRIDLEGATVIIEESPGAFQAPAWTPDARALVYSRQTDEGDVLVSSGTDGEGLLELARYDGYLTFVVSPASNRIALQVVDPTNQSEPGVVTAAAPATQPGFPAPQVPTGELYMIATFGSDLISVSPVAATAFFWSPDGESLAWIEPTAIDGALWYQWFFLTPEGFIDGPVFRPSDTLLSDFLPFFDQFAKSITFWSPAGDQLVFAGTDVNGEQGVFVHDVAFGGATTRIADGQFAAWSPTAAGDAAASAL